MTMNPIFVACLLFALAGTATAQQRELTPAEEKARDMRMPQLDRSALEPERREPAKIEEGERNPFGLIALPKEETEDTVAIQTETEEMRLRRVLGNMRISGVSGSPGDYRVVLGSMHVSQGDTLPKLFLDQAEILRVTSITDREVTLSFVEKDPSIPPRTIGLAYDLTPRASSLLHGEVFQKLVPFTGKGAIGLKPLEVPALKAITEGAEEGKLQALTERTFELTGEPNYRADDEPPAENQD